MNYLNRRLLVAMMSVIFILGSVSAEAVEYGRRLSKTKSPFIKEQKKKEKLKKKEKGAQNSAKKRPAAKKRKKKSNSRGRSSGSKKKKAVSPDQRTPPGRIVE